MSVYQRTYEREPIFLFDSMRSMSVINYYYCTMQLNPLNTNELKEKYMYRYVEVELVIRGINVVT